MVVRPGVAGRSLSPDIPSLGGKPMTQFDLIERLRHKVRL
jgi:hypothetical protein